MKGAIDAKTTAKPACVAANAAAAGAQPLSGNGYKVRLLLVPLEDLPTRRAVVAERSFLSGLGGGCSLPVAAYASAAQGEASMIQMTGLVASPDGTQSLRVSGRGAQPEELGVRLAREAIAQGALEILRAGKPE